MVDQALKDFINQSLAKGISKEDLKKVLIKKGWDAKDVNLAMNSGAPVTNVSQMKKPETVAKKPFNKKWLLIGAGILVVLFLFGIAGYWGYSMLGSVDGLEATDSCVIDSDCGTGYECSRGSCVYVGSSGDDDDGGDDEDECNLDSDCSTGYECSFGTCVASSDDGSDEDETEEEVNCTGSCITDCPEYCAGTEVIDGVTVYADLDPDNITEGSCGDWTECEYNLPFANNGEAKFSNAWNINCSLYAENGSLVDYDKISVHDIMEGGSSYSVTAEFDVEGFMPTITLEEVTVICTLDMFDNITESNESNNMQEDVFLINRTVIPTYDCDYSFIEGASLSFDFDTLEIVSISSTEVNVSVDGVAGSVFAKTTVDGLDVEVTAVFGDYVNMTVYNQTVCPHYELDCLNDKYCGCNEICSLGVCVAGPAKPECGDGCDNDGDLLYDWPDDPECVNADDDTEDVLESRCNDGLDNDFDLLVDWPSDPGCFGPYDDDERNACTDRIDNDGDGLYDLDDPGCEGAADDNEWNECNLNSDCGTGWKCEEMVCVQGECNDGLDNDYGGRVLAKDGSAIRDGIDYAGACEFDGFGSSTVTYSCEEIGYDLDLYEFDLLVSLCKGACPELGGVYIDADEGCGSFDDSTEDDTAIAFDYTQAEVGILDSLLGLLGGGEEECVDTDGGKDYFVKGSTQKTGGITYTDQCNDLEVLNEFYCNEDGFVYGELYDCSYGCSDGACQYKGVGVDLVDAEVNVAVMGNGFSSCVRDSDCGMGWICEDSGICGKAECNDGVNNDDDNSDGIDKYGVCVASGVAYACDELEGVVYENGHIVSDCKYICNHDYGGGYTSGDDDCEDARDDSESYELEVAGVEAGNLDFEFEKESKTVPEGLPNIRRAAGNEDLAWYQNVWNWLFIADSVDVLNY